MVGDLFCSHCGHRNPADSRFCSSCGNALVPSGGLDRTTSSFTPETEPDEAVSDLEYGEVPTGVGVLVVKRGPNVGSRFALESPVVRAGRHPESDIFLDDITVSRRHVEIRREADDYVLHDVGSLNGTYVNRERVDSALLHNGDEVQIGTFKLVFLNAARGGLG